MALGAHLARLPGRVLAYGVCDTPDYFYNHADECLAALEATSTAVAGKGALAGSIAANGGPATAASAQPVELSGAQGAARVTASGSAASGAAFSAAGSAVPMVLPPARQLFTAVQARGSGYAISKEDELQTICDIAAATGIILDPVYGGKALHYFMQDVQRNPAAWADRDVLFVHTGGLLGLYDKVGQLAGRLPGSGVQRMDVACGSESA